MSCPPKCLPPKGQLFHFPPTGGPLLVIGEAPSTHSAPRCGPCPEPSIPRGTVVFFGPPKVPPPFRPPMPPAKPRPPAAPRYSNGAQTCVNTCPDESDPISVTVPAGVFVRDTQEAADAAAMASACAQAAALRLDSPCTAPGSLWGWGYQSFNELGMGDNLVKSSPILVGLIDETTWTKITGDEIFSAGIKSDGTLWAWGANFEGNLGQGTQSVFPSSAYNAAFPIQVGSATDWADISLGRNSAIGLKTDGSIYTWGYNFFGQLGVGDNTDRLIPTQISGSYRAIAFGLHHSVVIKSDGTLWATGRGSAGQLGQGNTASSNVFIQIGSDADWAFVAAGAQSTVAIKSDGTIWRCGSLGGLLMTQMGTDSDWVAASVGTLSNPWMLAKKSNGTLWGWGVNDFGMLGDGTTTPSTTAFVASGSDSDWAKFQCGNNHVVAMKTDGTIWGWGNNQNYQLGQGTTNVAVTSAIQIGPDDKWIDIGVGANFSFGIRSDASAPPPPPGTEGVASGGYVRDIGGYRIHTFQASDLFNVNNGAGVLFDLLVVGGGAGGGGFGGGGGGQVLSATGLSMGNGIYPVTVGMFGASGGGGSHGQNGGNSAFGAFTALGGGYGGAYDDTGNQNGGDGSSGGGAGQEPGTGILGTHGNGSAGGNGGDASYTAAVNPNPGGLAGGGGGGAGANGGNGSTTATTGVGGTGGAGVASSISGTSVIYGAGGGGGGTTTAGAGGSSGSGGRGAKSLGPPADFGQTPGSGGGGGAGFNLPLAEAGVGSRGIVIIRYLLPP